MQQQESEISTKPTLLIQKLYYKAHLIPRLLRFRRLSNIKIRTLAESQVDKPKIIVALTTHGSRVQTVHMAIRSIMDQTVQPNSVVLYLDEETDATELPMELLNLRSLGLKIKTGYPNLKPHLKYFYAMQQYPDSCVVTIDDDMIYDRDTIQSLVNSYTLYPRCVSARRVHRIRFGENNTVLPYRSWEWEWNERAPRPRQSLLATGVGGVLYPPHIFPETAFDDKAVRELALTADDIWLKVIEWINDVPVVYSPNRAAHPMAIPSTQDDTLNSVNVFENMNDVILNRLMRHYRVDQQRVFDQACFTDRSES